MRTKRAPDGNNARPERRAEHYASGRGLQTPDGWRGTEEEDAHGVAGLAPGCPLCADDDYASDKEDVTATGSRMNC